MYNSTMIVTILLKLVICIGVYLISCYGPRIMNSIVHGEACPATQVKLVATGFVLIVGGILFLI